MSQIPEACDYRRPECSNTGMEIDGRWYCLNHLKSEDNPFVKLRKRFDDMQQENQDRQQLVEMLRNQRDEIQRDYQTLLDDAVDMRNKLSISQAQVEDAATGE